MVFLRVAVLHSFTEVVNARSTTDFQPALWPNLIIYMDSLCVRGITLFSKDSMKFENKYAHSVITRVNMTTPLSFVNDL